ncbi:MAG: MATE family efflux transporter [Clostridia bacterium]
MTKDMTKGTPWKLILAFFLPMLAGNCFQQLYSMVDSIIVGKGLGDKALAAVGSTGSLNFLILGFITGLTGGVAIPMAQAFGSRDDRRLRRVIAMSLVVCGAGTVLITALSLIFIKPLMVLLQTPADILGNALSYMRVILWGMAATVAYNYCAGLLRALGDSKSPFISLIISSIVNVALDIVFIFFLHSGVAGAAVATVISQAASVGFCLLRLAKIPQITMCKRDFEINFNLIGNLIGIGLPVAFMNSVTAIGCMMLQYFVNKLGSDYTAAYSACTRLINLFDQPCMTLGMAASTFVGQNLGAGEIGRIKTGVRSCVIISLAMNIPLGLIMMLFPDGLSSIMLSDPGIIALTRLSLPVNGACLWALGLLFVFRSSAQSMGHTVVPMSSGFVELGLRMLFVIILSGSLGFFGIALADVSAWIGAMLMLMLYYFHVVRKLEKSVARVRQ